MTPALLVRLRPRGAWRVGVASGALDQVDRIYHSDTLFSALCHAFGRLGMLSEWLKATAENSQGAAVRLSSLFPYLGETRFVPPPRILWPPDASSKLNWAAVRLMPLPLVRDLLSRRPLKEEDWMVDGGSGCLISARRTPAEGPFRISTRTMAGIDRFSGQCLPHAAAVLEFHPAAGLWFVAVFENEESSARWREPLEAALRLLADTGFGGGRNRGWGQAEVTEFRTGNLEDFIPTAPLEARRQLLRRLEHSAEEGATPGGHASQDVSEIAAAAAPSVEMEPACSASPTSEESTAAPNRDDAEAPGGEAAASEQTLDSEPDPAAGPSAPPSSDAGTVPGAGESMGGTPVAAASSASVLATVRDAPLAVTSRPEEAGERDSAWWLLSLFSPAESDCVDWERGNYSIVVRQGRVESPGWWGALTLAVRMVEEGSVLYAAAAPTGAALNVAPSGMPHAIYRAGFALAVPIHWRVNP